MSMTDLPLATPTPTQSEGLCAKATGTTLGSYLPLTWSIDLPALVIESGIIAGDAGTPSEADLTLIHEHEHLIQDTTTYYGVLALCRYLDMLTSLPPVNVARPRAELEQLQSVICATPKTDGWYQWRLASEGYAPADFECEKEYTVLDVTSTPVGLIESHVIHAVTVKVSQRNKRRLDLRFGAYVICEALAAILDEELRDRPIDRLPKSGKAPPYPYGMVRAVAKHLAKSRGVPSPSPAALAVFCDRSLGTMVPGQSLYAYLQAYLSDHRQDPHAVCDEVDQATGWDAATELRDLVQQFRALVDHLDADGEMRVLLNWLRDYVTTGAERRLANRDAYLQPFLSGDPWKSCAERIDLYPMPLVTDGSRKLKASAGEQAVAAARFLQGLHFANQILTRAGADPCCTVYDSCNLAEKGPVCRTAPWMHALGAGEQVCAIGSAFSALGVR